MAMSVHGRTWALSSMVQSALFFALWGTASASSFEGFFNSWNLCEKNNVMQCDCPENLIDANRQGIDCSSRNIKEQLKEFIEIPSQYNKLDLSRNLIEKFSPTQIYLGDSLLSLDLSDNRLTNIEANSFQNVKRLRNLELKNNNISFIDVEAFCALIDLTRLDLSYNHLATLHSDTFCKLANLQELVLAFNPLMSLDESLLKNLTNLRRLDLSSLGLHTLHANVFVSNHLLQSLSISHNQMGVIPTKALWHVRDSLKELDLSANLFQSLESESFFGMKTLQIITLQQLLKLKFINAYAFSGLDSLETLTIEYMPRLQGIDPKAFTYLNNQSIDFGFEAQHIPLKDLTFAFSTLESLPEELLNWENLVYLSLQYNHWTCDCNMAWVKDSTVEKLTGTSMICSQPLRLRGIRLTEVQINELTCGKEERSSSPAASSQSEQVTGLVLLIVLGIVGSIATVAVLVYRRHGWLCQRPSTSNYNHIVSTKEVITIVGEPEWDNADVGAG